MAKDDEVGMKDVELNEVDPEKQPMTAGETGNGDASSPVTEKNGIVKVKIPDEKETKFTGLSKEELLKVAGTPGWVRARWALLILFWLGWVGMLAGAIVIIVQAPRCKPLPEMNWWNNGPMYQIGAINSFTEIPGLKGLEAKINALSALKMKSLVVGPIHVSTANKPEQLNLEAVSSNFGSLEELKQFVAAAHKKSISVVLDLTPNYNGLQPFFEGHLIPVAEKLKNATAYWLKQGVDGILLYGVEHIAISPLIWNSIKDTIRSYNDDEKKKVLIGVTEETSPEAVSILLNRTGVDLLLSGVLRSRSGTALAEVVESLNSIHTQTQLAWNIGDRVKGHLASLVGSVDVKLSQLLLLTLPGTAVFNYGDEIGLKDEVGDHKHMVYPVMVWPKSTEAINETEKELSERISFFKTVTDLRSKERSLLHGDYLTVYNSSSALAYVRKWDQSERFLVAFNWSPSESVILQLAHEELPKEATIVVSTDEGKLAPGHSVSLSQLELGPDLGVMLKFPYTP
ncbi:solute carrier family 3 member 2b [Electrophorus electricus]|uniref:Glycosyl hydrolase family 13 catalytic domain-containing protein n=1 Tax=Electrophorus electricus TaxID=8005 RepID=A0A4W4E7U7_ELEEL|nr:solute carrier family 3 member 2b [Electrophorus electricus]XP_026879645.2 solute carrier family 3 member 2b [Electrophorus electricus]